MGPLVNQRELTSSGAENNGSIKLRVSPRLAAGALARATLSPLGYFQSIPQRESTKRLRSINNEMFDFSYLDVYSKDI